jgi:hypothetical protein
MAFSQHCMDNGGADALHELLAQESRRGVAADVATVAARIGARHGPGTAALLFYGACLRSGGMQGGILDLYCLVDSYRDAYARAGLALANACLPPNVFYYEERFNGGVVRAKYAVISMRDFGRAVAATLLPALWARFAQPCAIVYARSERDRAAVLAHLETAVVTFVRATLPLLPDRVYGAELWRTGLAATYATELRPESPDVAAGKIIDADPQRYVAVTRAAAARLDLAPLGAGPVTDPGYVNPVSAAGRRIGRWQWGLRRWAGKAMNVLRLCKALFTFDGGIEYALWKVERHSGVRLEPTVAMRRCPRLFVWLAAWRLYRKGGFR